MKKSEKFYPPSFINNNNLGQTLWLILQIFLVLVFGGCLFSSISGNREIIQKLKNMIRLPNRLLTRQARHLPRAINLLKE